MCPKKLTNDEKEVILHLYRHTPETTSTLADHYGVSRSTISRFLKNTLSETEYEELIGQKRLGRTQKSHSDSTQLLLPLKPSPESASGDSPSKPKPTPTPPTTETVKDTQPAPPILKKKPVTPSPQTQEDDDDELEAVDVITLGEMLGEDLDDSDDDWDDDDDDDDSSELDENSEQSVPNNGSLRILPLSAATLGRTCYLVVNRRAELIVKPLEDFAHLGQLPPHQVEQKTLPVFDNHRFARRFSNRFQRVLTIPDGRLLLKTSAFLQAKGITHLFLDGQIYSLT